MNNIRLLITSDNLQMRQQCVEALYSAGYTVHECASETTIQQMSMVEPDLIVLDDGCDDENLIMRQIRVLSDIPVIVISSQQLETDVLAAFEAGADDYMLKPVRFKELIVRIGAILKRCKFHQISHKMKKIILGDLIIDLKNRRVIIGENEVYLTATEFNLLTHLANHANQICLHEQMLTEVWGSAYQNEIDYLRSYVHNLRKKLERQPTQPELIITVQGVGYMLVNANNQKRGRV